VQNGLATHDGLADQSPWIDANSRQRIAI
jgi:hypothetical protein